MEESTHAEPNIRTGRRRTTKDERLKLDVAQNVGVPTSSTYIDSLLTDSLDTWLS